MNQKFYMVYSPQGCAPTRRHETKQLARDEARRLASCNSGCQFYVLAAFEKYEMIEPVQVTDLTDAPLF